MKWDERCYERTNYNILFKMCMLFVTLIFVTWQESFKAKVRDYIQMYATR